MHKMFDYCCCCYCCCRIELDWQLASLEALAINQINKWPTDCTKLSTDSVQPKPKTREMKWKLKWTHTQSRAEMGWGWQTTVRQCPEHRCHVGQAVNESGNQSSGVWHATEACVRASAQQLAPFHALWSQCTARRHIAWTVSAARRLGSLATWQLLASL